MNDTDLDVDLTITCEGYRKGVFGPKPCKQDATVHVTLGHQIPGCEPTDLVYCPHCVLGAVPAAVDRVEHYLQALVVFGHADCTSCGQCIHHPAELIRMVRI